MAVAQQRGVRCTHHHSLQIQEHVGKMSKYNAYTFTHSAIPHVKLYVSVLVLSAMVTLLYVRWQFQALIVLYQCQLECKTWDVEEGDGVWECVRGVGGLGEVKIFSHVFPSMVQTTIINQFNLF